MKVWPLLSAIQNLARHSGSALLSVAVRTEEISLSCSMTVCLYYLLWKQVFLDAREDVRHVTQDVSFIAFEISVSESSRTPCVKSCYLQWFPFLHCYCTGGCWGGGFGVSTWAHLGRVGSKEQVKDGEKKEYTWQEKKGLTLQSGARRVLARKEDWGSLRWPECLYSEQT